MEWETCFLTMTRRDSLSAIIPCLPFSIYIHFGAIRRIFSIRTQEDNQLKIIYRWTNLLYWSKLRITIGKWAFIYLVMLFCISHYRLIMMKAHLSSLCQLYNSFLPSIIMFLCFVFFVCKISSSTVLLFAVYWLCVPDVVQKLYSIHNTTGGLNMRFS